MLDNSLSRIERPDPVSTEVARRLLDFLLSGEIGVGQRIPSERQLATALGVGRSAIREAIKPLQLLGLVEVRIGDGTYLKEADSELLPRVIEWGLLLKAHKMLELVETRRYIEIALAGLAADRRDEAALERIRSQLETMRRTAGRNMPAFAEADAAFHVEIARAAENSVLAGMLSSLRALLRVWIGRVLRISGEAERALREHEAILKALESGDRRGAEKAMGVHIDRVTRRLRESLAEADDSRRTK